MRSIDYDHKNNEKIPLTAATKALSHVFELTGVPHSLLDVGCGQGVWLKAAQDLGVERIWGVDGVELPDSQFFVSKTNFGKVDLEQHWQLCRKYDLAISVEVAEHITETSARLLIECLTLHADTICFSAASPGQGGQHHVNLQWPSYWQSLFNGFGFRCDDTIRWILWDEAIILPWFRQNMFLGVRDEKYAGTEKRIPAVIHPAMLDEYGVGTATWRTRFLQHIHNGSQSIGWYLTTPLFGISSKLRRMILRKIR